MSRVLLCGDVAESVGFTNYSAIAEYVLGSSSAAAHIVGTLILLRVEDWLRPELKASDSVVDVSWVRQRLLVGVEEVVSLLTTLASRGKPVWFVACPSSGWITAKHEKLNALCRPYTSLLEARIGKIPGVTLVKWPGNLMNVEIDDRGADRLGQMPYTRAAFDQLGEILGAQITSTFVHEAPPAPSSDGTASPELAAYLAGLQVQVRLMPVGPDGRRHVDRLLRIPATFTLTGEKNDLAETEVDAVMNSGDCLLIDVSDRLSHYGPSGVIHYVADGGAMAVKTMSLSCAVLGKQVEYAAVSALTDLAVERGFAKMTFEYTPAGRNQWTRSFLQSIAAEESETLYVLPVHSAKTRLRAAAAAASASTATWQDDAAECVAR